MRPFIMKLMAGSATALLGLGGANHALALEIPGADGSDGALVINYAAGCTKVIDLAQAVTGAWNSPGAGNGVYDPDKWAVVFKYSSVSLSGSGCSYGSIKFLNHPSNAPVVWLVSGDVTIPANSEVILSAATQGTGGYTLPGPGGFRGGITRASADLPASGGFGPGGGAPGADNVVGQAGNYATQGTGNTGPTYGNARVLPLLGGSGGGGSNEDPNYFGQNAGGGGGGALLIAATGTITLNGKIYANGTGATSSQYGGSGSGGAVRLVAETIAGTTGRIEALGPTSDRNSLGGVGRIRLETNNYLASLVTVPSSQAAQPDNPVLIWPPATAPAVKVVSVAGASAPSDPRAQVSAADLTLSNVPTGDIVLETRNVQPDASVVVRVVPAYGEPFSVNATRTAGDATLATWTAANVTLPANAFVVQARAENPAP